MHVQLGGRISRGLPKAVKELLNKSIDAALLAIETYNKPATKFRSFGYIVMMHIAWNSLLLACFERDGKKPYFKESGRNRYILISGERKRWDLSKCISEYWGGIDSPVAKNLSFFVELRNKIEHSHLPQLDMHVFGECQAMLFNYEELLENEFGTKWAISENLVIPLQFSRIRSEEGNQALRTLLKPLPNRLGDWIKTFRSSLSDDMLDNLAFSYKIFLVPNVKNNFSKDALPVEFIKFDPENQGDVEKVAVLIKEKIVLATDMDLLRPGEVVDRVSKVLSQKGKKFNMYHHTRCWEIYKVRPPTRSEHPENCKREYCSYSKPFARYSYTIRWVEFLIKELSDDAKYERI